MQSNGLIAKSARVFMFGQRANQCDRFRQTKFLCSLLSAFHSTLCFDDARTLYVFESKRIKVALNGSAFNNQSGSVPN